MQEHHAAWLRNLRVLGWTLFQWVRWLGKFSLWSWSVQCAQAPAQGQMWTDVEWYEFFQDNLYHWSSPVWCLCLLHISPDKARRMIRIQFGSKQHREFRDDKRDPEGGTSSSSCL